MYRLNKQTFDFTKQNFALTKQTYIVNSQMTSPISPLYMPN